jgi:protein translocase SecG subunit
LIPTLLAAAAVPSPAVAPVAPVAPATPAAPPLPVVSPAPTPIAQHWPWLTHGIAGIFVISAISLIFLLAIQTTKQEGLTGSIGGRVESTYRGRLGADEQLKRFTGWVAVTFVVMAFILSLTGI